MNSTEQTQMTLPALCFRGLVPLPNNDIKVELARSDSARTLKEIMESQDKLFVMLAKKDFLINKDNANHFNKIGVVAKISALTEVGGLKRLAIRTIVRCEIDSYEELDPIIKVNVTTKPSTSSSQTRELACIRLLIPELDQKTKALFKGRIGQV